MLVSMLLRRLAAWQPEQDPPSECERWFADPLSHPELERMDLRQLGDLPIGMLRRRGDETGCRCEPP